MGWMRLTACAAMVGGAVLPAQALTVYDNDFSNPPVVAAGVNASFIAGGGATIGTTPAYSPTYGDIFRNSSTGLTELTLSNLPAHSAVSVRFLLGFLDSWDSTNGTPAPDFVNVYIDQALIGQYTSNNASGNVSSYGGGVVILQNVQFDTNQFYNDVVVDHGADPAYTLAHAASTLTIGFQASGAGWQAGTDEAWGIDNLSVTLAPVPEPASVALMLAGLGALAARARRHR